MASREDMQVVLTGQDNTRQAFDSLKRNAQGAQSAVGNLAGAFSSLGNANISGILSLPSAFAGLGGTAAAIAAIALPLAAIAYGASSVKEGAVAFGEYAKGVRNAAE